MRKIVIPVALLVLGVVMGGTVFAGQVAHAASSVLSVFVTNGPSHPVPAQEQNLDANGNIKVHEQGTASVNVTNTTVPVHEQGTAQVNVANMPGAAPFMKHETVVLGAGDLFASTCDSVPAGRTFAMEYIDLQTNGIGSGEVVSVSLDATTGGAFVPHPLPLQVTAGDVPMFSSPVRMYADPGSGFCLSVHREASGDTSETIRADYSVSGYLISSGQWEPALGAPARSAPALSRCPGTGSNARGKSRRGA
jgi:hypothetical protein